MAYIIYNGKLVTLGGKYTISVITPPSPGIGGMAIGSTFVVA